MTQLILASASPARLETLRRAGVEPSVQVSDVDEDAILERLRAEGPLDPKRAVLELARAKCAAVADQIHDDSPASQPTQRVVVGCDSMLELDGEILGKPYEPEVAIERWKTMRGRSGVLHSGHWVRMLGEVLPGEGVPESGDVSSTIVHFANVTDREIADYVATGEPLHVAGAFTIDGFGGPFISGIEGDHHGVLGLSLPLLRLILGRLGVSWTSLWNR